MNINKILQDAMKQQADYFDSLDFSNDLNDNVRNISKSSEENTALLRQQLDAAIHQIQLQAAQLETLKAQLTLAQAQATAAKAESDEASKLSKSANRIAVAAIVISCIVSFFEIIFPLFLS